MAHIITLPNGGWIRPNEFTNRDGSPSYSLQNGPTSEDGFATKAEAKAVAAKMGLKEFEVKLVDCNEVAPPEGPVVIEPQPAETVAP